MVQSRSRSPLRTLVLAAAALVSFACAGGDTFPTGLSALIDRADTRPVALGTCDSLAAPQGAEVVFRAYATGVQIYRWNGTAWGFVAPEATLFVDSHNRGYLGTHFVGPTWELSNGDFVKAAVQKRCPAGDTNIPWLLLGVNAGSDQGPLGDVTHIQRLNTVGGIAPATPGAAAGEERRVPYTAVYVFFRALN